MLTLALQRESKTHIDEHVDAKTNDVQRQNPEATPDEKRRCVKSAASILLAHGKRRDQEATEHEEQRHAVPACQELPVASCMDKRDAEDGDGAETVERCEVPHGAVRAELVRRDPTSAVRR